MKSFLPFLRSTLLLAALAIAGKTHAQKSMLAAGKWIKFEVAETGVYKIDFDLLKKAGIEPTAIDPRNIQLFTFPTGMLPQLNTGTLLFDLQQIDIKVSGEDDGKFDAEDVVMFFGQGPDLVRYDANKNVVAYEKNLYSDVNYYFLTVGQDAGDRVVKKTETAGGRPEVNEFAEFGYYEKDLYNDLKSGRDWFGEQITSSNVTLRFNLPGIIPGSDIRIVSSVMAQTYYDAFIKCFWNDHEVLNGALDTIPKTQYGIKGTIRNDTILINESALGAAAVSNHDIRYELTKATQDRSVAYLNYIMINMRRKLASYGGTTLFTIPPQQQDESDISMSDVPSGTIIWDVTTPFDVMEKTITASGNNIKFYSNTTGARNFIAFTSSDLKAPTLKGAIENQDFDNFSTPDLLIVTHPLFLDEANRLASHRRSSYGLDVLVVTTETIYNQLSGGRQDVTAIRNFVRLMYAKSPGKLKNLLLFGRPSYDYKARVFNNSDYVPTYESRNSLSPLETYSSDDYYGFLEEGEGNWSEKPARNHTLDIGVGRIPVRSPEDAAKVVDKLIAYDTDPARLGGWRKNILIVADDGDFNLHQSQASDLATDIETVYDQYHTNKIFLDAFKQERIASGQVSPQATKELDRQLNKGYAIVNYTGHGSEQVWMQERILDASTPASLVNNPRLPLFVTATCEFGRYDDPLLISTAELLLLKEKSGAIGLVTTTRPVNSSTNFALNRKFYSAFFNSSTSRDIGSIFRETKNSSLSGTANRNFSLLGDPSMKFGPPAEEAFVTSVTTLTDSDTLKASSTAIIEGEIRKLGVLSSDFNGQIEVELFGKQSDLVTLGDENAPFPYKVWDHAIFRGKATVANGRFEVSTLIPVNLAPAIGKGKISLYASTNDKKREALGTKTDFKVGSAEANPMTDTKGPSISLFMGDTTFVNGGYANTNTLLIGNLSDKSGINVSGYDPTNILATLDDTTNFVVNDYFISDLDDFTSGPFAYPITGLSPGRHRIVLKAWDNYNNTATASIDFIVAKDGQLIIQELSNYPNPFSESTTIEFTHSRSGEDLEAQVAIYDIMGQLADVREFQIPSSPYRVTLFEWDGHSTSGTKMNNGLYLVKVIVRSLADGAKNDKIAKLILVN